MSGFLGFLLKLFSGDLVDRALKYLERKADTETERQKIRTQASIESIKAAVQETQIMADLNKSKFQFPWFWIFASIFLVPLSMWWTAILLDSIFHFDWRISDLPTAELKAMAKDMVSWVFYVGGGVGALKMITK